MRKTVGFVFVGMCVVALSYACGGSSDDNSGLTDATADAGGTSLPPPGTTPPGTTPPGTTPPPGSVTDAGDGSVAQGGDGGVNPADAGPGGSTSLLTCGATSCSIPSQSCCVTPTGAGPSFGCVTGACPQAQGSDVTGLKCGSAANCAANTVCCARRQKINGGDVVTSSCEASCNGGGVQLCDPNAAASGCTGQACSAPQGGGDLGLPASFGTCGGNGF